MSSVNQSLGDSDWRWQHWLGGSPPGHLATYTCGNNNENATTLVSQQAINDGVFHHVVLTRKGTTTSYYIDGVLDASKTIDRIANLNNAGMFRVGQSVCVCPGVAGFDRTRPFVGELDRIDVFDRALSTPEISAFHRAGRGDHGAVEIAAPKIPVEKSITESGGLFKTVLDTNSGQYVIVSPDQRILILKDRFDKIIWSTNVIEYLKKFEFPEEKNHGEKRITNVEILKGEIIISAGRDFARVNKRTGEVTYEGAD